MIEAFPKLADLKFLRELSRVVIVPMLVAAYLIQSQFSLFGISVNPSAPIHFQLLQFVGIFLLSTALIGFVAWGIHELLLLVQFYTRFVGLSVLSTIFLAFGFLGIFGESVPLIMVLDEMWFYTAFVCGFYFLARAAEIEEKIR